ncbi:unnamed protein product [Ophioblennius macclurei]
MPSLCAALGCPNTKAEKKGVRFYYFPRETGRRGRWISAIGRKHWTPTSHSRLCSEHFVSGRKSNSPLNPDYVPSLFQYLTPVQRQRRIDNYIEYRRKCMSQYGILDGGVMPPLDSDLDMEDDDAYNSETGEHDDSDVQSEETVEMLRIREEVDEFLSMYEAPKGDGGNNTAKRKLEVEADDIKDGGPSSKVSKSSESETKKLETIKNFDRFPLSILAKRFTELLHCNNAVFDLNEVAQRFDVPKRRLYDITNVLQGIMLLKKDSKNLMRWLGPPLVPPLREELKTLEKAETKLDELIEICRSQVLEANCSLKYAYVTYEDLRKIPSLRNQSVIVISAPVETQMEVSHPKDGFKIYLRSSQGPIDAFTLRDDDVSNETSAPSPKDSHCGIPPHQPN